ncbi:MAG: rhomboid family intramembrane serine protease, partial [Xanthomonadales bacterium]|nr:rhomboid family intramembrane serine protease [Xanthomonadales bacterium]
MTQPPVSIGLIGACVVIFLMQNVSAALALWPLNSGYFEPWQILSYGFLHGSFNHIFFNMFALWMFGLPIERVWGSKRFAVYYLVCVIGAG